MTLRTALSAMLGVVGLAGCGSKPCAPPAGCVRVSDVRSCTCAEWETVSVETVPLKYVVVSVVYAAPGNATTLTYGYTGASAGSMPQASSDMGSRVRAVVRGVDGRETVAALGDVASEPGTNLLRVTDASLEYWLAGGDGQGSGGALGISTDADVPSSHARDAIWLWVNPAV